MNITENLKNGVCFIADTASEIAESIAEKNRLKAQLNHLKKLIKADSATRDQAYIELGRFFYENLRENAAPENEALCAVVDSTSERITKASLKYMEVLSIHNNTKIRSENVEKLMKVMAEKAAVAADKAKVQGAQLARKTKEFAEETTEKAKEFAKEKAEQAKDATVDTVENIVDKANEAVEDIKTSAEIEELIKKEQKKVEAAEEAAEKAAEETAEAAEDATEEAAENPSAAEESPESFDF